MSSLKNRIYLSTFVNTFGSWLTFLAIALITKEKYGASHVALVFLMQTLPAIIFSRSLAQLIPQNKIEKYYWVTQVLLAVSSFVLIFNQSLIAIYSYLFITALLKSVSNPLFNTLIGRWIAQADQKQVFTKVGALQAGTLALAPAVGAWIKITFSATSLFAIDALTFIVSIIVLKELFRKNTFDTESVSRFDWKLLLQSFSRMPKDTPKHIQSALTQWFLFLGVGALLNAIEFAGFENVQMTEKQIGYAMTAWGLGNLVAFLVKNPFSSPIPSLIGYASSLLLFVLAPSPMALILSFVLAGLCSSYLSGSLRASIQGAVPSGYNPLPVWAYTNQLTQIINLIAYVSAGVLLDIVGYYTFGFVMIAVLVLMGIKSLRFAEDTKLPI